VTDRHADTTYLLSETKIDKQKMIDKTDRHTEWTDRQISTDRKTNRLIIALKIPDE
jgi:hypothetical protein